MATQKDEETQKIYYKLLSTQSTFNYLIQQYFDIADFDEDQQWINIHSPKVMSLLRLPRTLPATFNNSIPVTTQSNKLYGTTSLWWLIIMCSDYVHPSCIPTGTIIMLPTAEQIQSQLVEETYNGLRGQIVTI